MQVREEWEQLIAKVDDRLHDVVVEIGTARGGSLYTWCRALSPPPKLVVSIDLPEGKFGGGYPREKEDFFQQFVDDRPTELVCLRGDSHEEETLTTLEEVLSGRAIDCLYIDGDHSYGGVKQDFEMYRPLLAPDGMVLFDDLYTHERDNDYIDTDAHEVGEFWEELTTEYQTEEVVAERDSARLKGLGIVDFAANSESE
jgi:predicted O-methyltransferase YrrM